MGAARPGRGRTALSDPSEPDRALIGQIRSAYEGSAQEWAAGPAEVYRRLAAALIDAAPFPLDGTRVLDLGAGTGVASEILTEQDAAPVGVDLALAMLAHERARRPPGVVADAQALPFRNGVFDAIVAAFCLNHVPDVVGALVQCRRVTRVGGVVLASTFPSDDEHPAKEAVEAALKRFGYHRPGWYRALKDRLVASSGDAPALEAAAHAAGLTDVRVERLEVEARLDHPRTAVEWRLNMPHTVGFVAALAPEDRTALHEEATAALSGDLPSSVAMLVLRAQVAGSPTG